MRRCSKCNADKPLINFHATKRNPDGSIKTFSSWCSQCKIEKYHETSKSPKRFIAFICLNTKIKECSGCNANLPFSDFTKSTKGAGGISAYCKPCFKSRYYSKDQSRKQCSRYRSENREVWNAYHRVSQFNRVSKIKAVSDGTVTKEFTKSVYSTEVCYWCKSFIERPNRTMEHLIELSSGGPHSASNIVMACKSCNSSRFNKGVTRGTTN